MATPGGFLSSTPGTVTPEPRTGAQLKYLLSRQPEALLLALLEVLPRAVTAGPREVSLRVSYPPPRIPRSPPAGTR